MQLVVPGRVRMAIIWIAVLTLVIGVVAAPVGATDDHGHDNLAWARNYATEVVTHKLNLLRTCRDGARTDEVWAIYSDGIEELEAIKDRIADEDDVDEIWALKHRALDVYAETKDQARAADDRAEKNDEQQRKDEEAKKKRENEERKRKDEEAKKKREKEEQKRKDEEAKKKREQEEQKRKDEEARKRREAARLAWAKAFTLGLVDKKHRLMNAASLASRHDAMSRIYRDAATQLEALGGRAEGAQTLEELDAIRRQAWQIVHDAKKRVAAYRPGHDKDETAGEDEDTATTDDGGTTGEHIGNDQGGDQQDDGTGGDQQDDGAEEATILATLNGMELQVDMLQIEVSLAIVPEVGYGFPEGPAALTAGDELLDAIDAARLLTGDDLINAFLAVNDQYNEYIHLVEVFDLTWEAGIFNGQVTPV